MLIKKGEKSEKKKGDREKKNMLIKNKKDRTIRQLISDDDRIVFI